MRRVAEIAAFFGLSAALHAGILAQLPDPGGADGQGSGGADGVTLAAAPDSLAVLVDTWDRPPVPFVEVTPPIAPPETPVAAEIRPDSTIPDLRQPQFAEMPALDADPDAPSAALPAPPQPALALALTGPELPRPDTPTTWRQTGDVTPEIVRAAPASPSRPNLPDAPEIDLETPEPEGSALATAVSPRPTLRPDRLATQPAPSAPSVAQSGRVASGTGGGGTQGAATIAQPQTPALSAAERQSLMSHWGAQILRRIERSRPRFRGTGQVVIRLGVTPAGQLASLSVARSSGDPALDQAALSAAQRVGRFPEAPDGLTDTVYGFSLPIAFR